MLRILIQRNIVFGVCFHKLQKTKYDTDVPNRLLEQKSFIKLVLATHSFKHSNQVLRDRGKIDEIKTCLNFFDLKI